jgi:hypothetical protein
MKTKELMTMLDEGINPIIEFTKRISDINGPDFGMMGKVIRYRDRDNWGDGDVTIYFDIDMSEFEEHNKTKAKSDWYDKNSVPCLTWFESGMYPKDGIESICEMLIEKEQDSDLIMVEVVEVSDYFKEYQQSEFKGTYVKFLEDKLNNLKS